MCLNCVYVLLMTQSLINTLLLISNLHIIHMLILILLNPTWKGKPKISQYVIVFIVKWQ